MRDRTDEVREYGLTDHVLVYTNGRGSEYADRIEVDGPTVHDTMTLRLRGRDVFWSWAHVVETSCLGPCSADGAAVAIHPRNRRYSDVCPDGVPALLIEVFDPDAPNLSVRPRDWPPRERPSVSASRRFHRLLPFPPRHGRG